MQLLLQYLIFDFTFINIAILLLTAVFIYKIYQYQSYQYSQTGYYFDYYPKENLILFAPIFEEVIFRALILGFLMQITSSVAAVVVVSAVFGVWHIKNIHWQPRDVAIRQIGYTTLVLGPIFAVLTLYTGNILVPMLLHSANNYLAPIFNKRFGFTA